MIVSAGKPDKDQRVDAENYDFHFNCQAKKVGILSYENCKLLASLNVLTQKELNFMTYFCVEMIINTCVHFRCSHAGEAEVVTIRSLLRHITMVSL